MAEMGETFRNRLKDGVAVFPLTSSAVPVECEACRDIVRDDELFDGLCESCALELRSESDPRFEWDFVRDFAL